MKIIIMKCPIICIIGHFLLLYLKKIVLPPGYVYILKIKSRARKAPICSTHIPTSKIKHPLSLLSSNWLNKISTILKFIRHPLRHFTNAPQNNSLKPTKIFLRQINQAQTYIPISYLKLKKLSKNQHFLELNQFHIISLTFHTQHHQLPQFKKSLYNKNNFNSNT